MIKHSIKREFASGNIVDQEEYEFPRKILKGKPSEIKMGGDEFTVGWKIKGALWLLMSCTL